MYIHWVMPHLWEGTPEGQGEKCRWRINLRELLPQVGREANSTLLQLCSPVSAAAGKDLAKAF